ncbi:MAG: carotenoid 1,2-hydratase [Candidatus Limnocylindrales bacterium]
MTTFASPRRDRRVLASALLVVIAVGGCGGAPILANPPIVFPSPVVASPAPSRPADPIPISLPRDDGPHDRLTEWWYYTGHLASHDPSGVKRSFGFEAVVFRAERGSVPAAWASHLALTDEDGQRFFYAQRSEVGPQVDRSPRDAAGTPVGFDLNVSGLNPELIAGGAPPIAAPWHLVGAGGIDRIDATLTPEEAAAAGASFGFSLDLRPLKAPALHDGDGFVDFGPAGSSYYYSRTRMAATGVVQLEGERLEVDGIAWFDHQWGDFVSVGGGGWDWFAINLDDGTDITLSVVLDEHMNTVFQYGTIVRPSGEVEHLGMEDFGIADGFGFWDSPTSGRSYPVSKTLLIGDLVIILRPSINDQELDTRATTGVIYWEGSQTVALLRMDQATGEAIPLPGGGKAYLEVTRYDAPRR